MSIIEVAEDVVMWMGRVARVLPAFQALWQAVKGDRQEQIFAAQMELTRSIRREQMLMTVESEPEDAT